MSSFEPKDFETVLDSVEHRIDDLVECDVVRSIGGNLIQEVCIIGQRTIPMG